MEDFKKIISFDVVKKQRTMENILVMITNWPQIPEYDKLYKSINAESKGLISDEEFLVVYNLGIEILRLLKAGKTHNNKLIKYLFKEDNSIDYNNLQNFVNYSIEDIKVTRVNNPKQKWKLSINKILKKINDAEGKTKIANLRNEK